MDQRQSSLEALLAGINSGEFKRVAETIAAEIPVRPLADLRSIGQHDESELIKHRFLCRGGGILLAGPTGIGKSSFLMQCLIHWSVGLPCFGFEPARALRCLLIQAENDDGDLAEQRDGVIRGIELLQEVIQVALSRILVCSENTKSGEGLISRVHKILGEHTGEDKIDLVVLDPALAYLGGDSSQQKDVGRFLRNWLNPILTKFKVGCIIAHHTNKPLRGKEKGDWKAGDLAYLGAGSAEWANWSRGVIVIRSIGSHQVFELVASKRGGRLRWRDGDDGPRFNHFIAHHDEPGVICWRDAREDEVPADVIGPKPSKESVEQRIANIWIDTTEELTRDEFIRRAIETGTARRTAFRWAKSGEEKHVFRISSKGNFRLTGKFVPRPISENAFDGTVAPEQYESGTSNGF